ncbi:MAG: hypothetical protein ACOZB0_09825 [Pseudomonadota bacterium]
MDVFARWAAILLLFALLLDIFGLFPESSLWSWILFPLALFLFLYPLLRR